MVLPEDQIEGIKKQLLAQVGSTFPDDKKEAAKQQIEGMDAKQLEEFLIQNNLIKADGGGEVAAPPSGEQEAPGGQCVFCSLVAGDIPSTKVGENDKAIAILELNPISKGHTMVIPKDHIKSTPELPKEALELAGEIGGKLKRKLGARDVIIEPTNMFGHEIINVLPVYDNETLQSPKKQSSPEELAKVKAEFEVIDMDDNVTQIEEVEKKPEPEINEKNTWLKERIP